MLRRHAKSLQAILAGMIGGGVDQRRGKTRAVKMRQRAHQGIALERAWAAFGVEIEVPASPDQQHERGLPALRRSLRSYERIARLGPAVSLDGHHVTATAGRRIGIRLRKQRHGGCRNDCECNQQ